MAHADSFRINIDIADMHKLTARILDFSNAFNNMNVPIYELFYVCTPPYYIDWVESSYANFPLSRYDGPFCFQCMNGIKGTKPAGRKWNIILYAVVTVLKYKKMKINHAIYIKSFTDGTVSYLTVSTKDVINTTNNDS